MLVAIIAFTACDGSKTFIGKEDLGSSELRIVLARTEETVEIVALPVDRPYRFEAEPLEAVFDRGDVLEVAIFGFTRTRLEAGIPGVTGLNVEDLLRVLSPMAGPPGLGRYEPPPPEVILFGTVDGDAEVIYESLDWSAARGREKLQFGFGLPGAIACPPIDAPMRVFNRANPGTACVFSRTPACEWASSDCPHLDAIFGAAVPPNLVIRESPDRALSYGSTTCPPADLSEGETRAWTCGGEVVAAQEQVSSLEGTPWVPDVKAPLVTADLADPHQFAPSARGLLVAIDEGFGVLLRRIAIMGGQTKYQNIESPSLDGVTSTRPSSTVSSADGVTVTVSTDFDARIGVTPLQCFATLSGDRQLLAASIAGAAGNGTITLSANLGPISPTFSWHIIGDPGPESTMSPAIAEVRPPAIGALERITRSTDAAAMVVHGSAGTVRLVRLEGRFPNDLNWFTCALDIPHPAGLVGDIVAGVDRMYALASNGILELDAEGRPGRTIGSRTFTRDHRIGVVEGSDGADRIVVWHPQSRTVDHFDTTGTEDGTIVATGDISVVMSGPSVIAVDGNDVIVLDLSAGSERRIPVPPFSAAGGAVEILETAAVEVSGRALVGFRSGSYAGVLDLDRGFSSAVNIADGSVRALFEDDGQNAVWAIVEGASGSRAELLRTPLLP